MSKIIKCVSLHGKPLVVAPPKQEIIREKAEAEVVNTLTESTIDSIVLNSQAEAEALLREAELEANRLISAANDMIDKIRTEGQQEGYNTGYSLGLQEGYTAGLQQAQEQIDQSRLHSSEMIKNAERQALDMIHSAERQIIDIALCIARKILKREIEENPMTILPVVREALGKSRDGETIIIRVNPEDIDLLNHAKRDLLQIVGGDKQLSISADPAIRPGGCMIDTKSGTVDASIDTQFEAIKRALQDVLP